jgi:hypothetical protein
MLTAHRYFLFCLRFLTASYFFLAPSAVGLRHRYFLLNYGLPGSTRPDAPAVSLSRRVIWDRERLHVNHLPSSNLTPFNATIPQPNPIPCCRRSLVSAKACLRHWNRNIWELSWRSLLSHPPPAPYSLSRIRLGSANNNAFRILLFAHILLGHTHTPPAKRSCISRRCGGFWRLQ